MAEKILLDCGSGGRASHRLITGLFLKYLGNPELNRLNDAARLDLTGPLAMSTDTFTVDPIFFPGGNIGSLAVHGTVNDVSMLGHFRVVWPAVCIERGTRYRDVLEKIVASMCAAANEAGVRL
jgi:hydrogenase expression/formation protein HypE